MWSTRRLRLDACDRGPTQGRPKLFYRGPRQASVLRLTPTPGVECEVLIAARFARVVLVLVDAWHADAGQPDLIRGFRVAERIAWSNKMEPRTIPRYVSDMGRAIRKALDEAARRRGIALGNFDLFERRRLAGYQIGEHGIEIVMDEPAEPHAQ